MTLREYAKSALWDLLLCLLMSGALVTVVADGFNVDDALRLNVPLVYGACLVLQLILVVAVYSKRTLVPGIACLVVVCAVAVFAAAGVSTNEHIFADEYGNTLVFVVLLIAICVLVFVLSRRPLGAVVLAVAGIFAIVLMQFLYRHDPYLEFGLFGIAAMVNCLFRRYLCNLRASESQKTAFSSAVAVSLVLCIVASAVGVGVWFGVVAPLNPPAQRLVLITEYRSQPQEDVVATSTLRDLLNNDLTNQDASTDMTTNNANDEDPEEMPEESGSSQAQDQGSEGAGSAKSAMQVFYELVVQWWAVILVVLVLLVVGAVLFKRALRARRVSRIRALPAREQAAAFCHFFMRRLAQVGIAKNPEDTPREFLAHAGELLRKFDQGKGNNNAALLDKPKFSQVSAVCEKALYGMAEPLEEELSLMNDYYAVFYKRARAHVGGLRYLIKFWKL